MGAGARFAAEREAAAAADSSHAVTASAAAAMVGNRADCTDSAHAIVVASWRRQDGEYQAARLRQKCQHPSTVPQASSIALKPADGVRSHGALTKQGEAGERHARPLPSDQRGAASSG